jgi:hypothetical protein
VETSGEPLVKPSEAVSVLKTILGAYAEKF